MEIDLESVGIRDDPWIDVQTIKIVLIEEATIKTFKAKEINSFKIAEKTYEGPFGLEQIGPGKTFNLSLLIPKGCGANSNSKYIKTHFFSQIYIEWKKSGCAPAQLRFTTETVNVNIGQALVKNQETLENMQQHKAHSRSINDGFITLDSNPIAEKEELAGEVAMNLQFMLMSKSTVDERFALKLIFLYYLGKQYKILPAKQLTSFERFDYSKLTNSYIWSCNCGRTEKITENNWQQHSNIFLHAAVCEIFQENNKEQLVYYKESLAQYIQNGDQTKLMKILKHLDLRSF